jgi:LPS-assembly protein
LRVGGRVVFAKYWSIFASSIVDLTSTSEDPTTTNDGFSPVRHRIGVAYEDECFRIGFSWRHDYTFDRDYQPGNTYLFTVALKNLGPSPGVQ